MEERKPTSENECDGEEDASSMPGRTSSQETVEEPSNINTSQVTEDIGITETSSSVPRKFSFYLLATDWNRIEIQTTTRSRKLSGNWLNVFLKEFSKKVPSCPLTVKRNFVRRDKSRKSNGPFFHGKANCKFQGCLKFDFRIKKCPKEKSRVKVRVTVQGDGLDHTHGRTNHQHFHGEERRCAKDRIKETGAINFFYERMANADSESLAVGNLTGVGNKQVIQKMSSENNLENRISRDIITEIEVIKRMCIELDKASSTLKGYIQYYAIDPFCVLLYTQDQLEHLCHLVQQKEANLYFDATGCVIRKIPGQHKPVFYYPLLAKGTESPFPVAEMITNSHSTPDICNFLMRVYRSCCLLHPKIRPPQRIEVDFSWALINGILYSFNQENVLAYIARCSKIVQGHDDKMLVKRKTVVHICSAHVLHFMAKRFSKTSNDKGLRQFLLFICARMINCTMLDELITIFNHVCVLLLAPTKNAHPQFAASLSYLRKEVKSAELFSVTETDESEEEEEENNHELPDGETIKDSYFGRECCSIRNKVENALHVQDNDDENEYMSANSLDAIQGLMGSTPLWTGLMLGNLKRHRESDHPSTIKHDTNAFAENWMGIVKRHILMGKTRLQPGAFISKMYVIIRGKVAEMSICQSSKKKQQKVESSFLEEEAWAKKGKAKKKTKESKYFKDNSEIPEPKKAKKIQKEKKSGMNVLHWGGTIELKGKTIKLFNTCPVDNLLYMIYRLAQEKSDLQSWISTHKTDIPVCGILLDIFHNFNNLQWAEGRTIWLQECCSFSTDDKLWNVFGSEAERFVLPFAEMQESISRSSCSSRRCPRPERINLSREILLNSFNAETSLQTAFDNWENGYTVPCRAKDQTSTTECKGRRYWEKRDFVHLRPPLLLVSVSYLSTQHGLTGEHIVNNVRVLGKWYSVFGFTKSTSNGSHFVCFFRIEHQWFFYDGLSKPEVQVSTVEAVAKSRNLEHLLLIVE